MSYYRGEHRSQFDGGPYASANCTPTSGANGARCSTGGGVNRSGSYVRSLVSRSEETDPRNPGWSLWDLSRAMDRLGIPFAIHTRSSFSDILAWSNLGYGVAMQGISKVFTEGCSSAFDGGHCIYLHPDTKDGLRLIGDPICTSWRYERPVKLQQYVEGLFGKQHISFGVFTTRVPLLAPDTDTEAPVPDITAVKGEDWKAVNGNGVFRAEADRSLVPNERVPDGTVVRSIAEATTEDGNNWRLTERNGKPAWMIRTDWEPLVQGGDATVDAGLTNYIARKPASGDTVHKVALTVDGVVKSTLDV